MEALGLGRSFGVEGCESCIIYECYIMAEENYFSDQAVVSFRILLRKGLDRISLDVVDILGRQVVLITQLLEIF